MFGKKQNEALQFQVDILIDGLEQAEKKIDTLTTYQRHLEIEHKQLISNIFGEPETTVEATPASDEKPEGGFKRNRNPITLRNKKTNEINLFCGFRDASRHIGRSDSYVKDCVRKKRKITDANGIEYTPTIVK